MDPTQPAVADRHLAAALRRAAPALISLVLFFAALAVLRNQLRQVTWFELTRDVAATPRMRLAGGGRTPRDE